MPERKPTGTSKRSAGRESSASRGKKALPPPKRPRSTVKQPRPAAKRPRAAPRPARSSTEQPGTAPQGDLQAVATSSLPAEPQPAPELAPEIVAELQFQAGEGGEKPSALSAAAIAGVMLEIAALLDLLGENAFKVRAYDNAARALAGLGEDLDRLLKADRLHEVRGIGTSIAEKVKTLSATGHLPYYEELKSRVPPGLLEMLRIPGLGPKRVKALYDNLQIAGVEDLEKACIEGRLADLKGFGAKTAQNIQLGIQQMRSVQGTYLWAFAHDRVAPLVEELRRHPAVQRLEIAGSLRRRKETVHDVDILVSTRDPRAVMERVASGPWATRVLGSGDTKTSIVLVGGLQIDVRAVSDAQFPYALHHFTGSKQHNIAMRSRAVRAGIKMNEYGLFRGEGLLPCRDETEIFAALGLAYIAPELREDQGEIEAATQGGLPEHLLELHDLQGVFHVHSLYSDGRASLADMVRAAREQGWKYVGIADHSQSAAYAHGLRPERVLEQRREIERLGTAQRGIRILHGIESDILPDGRLDYDDDLLAQFDFVVASVHSGFRLSRDEQTRRLLRAVENPHTTMLGHPTGRILLQREGYELDLPAVIEAAARHGAALEINASPNRLDLDGGWAKQAREKGALLCVNPDAHSVDGLRDVRYGVGIARRGWLEPRHVLNAWSLEEVEAHLQRRRQRLQ